MLVQGILKISVLGIQLPDPQDKADTGSLCWVWQSLSVLWKIGRVVPVHKGKGLPRHLPASYRPITLLPVVSKLVERAVQEQIVTFMEQNQFFHPKQHAYRKGFSTTSALLQLSDQLFEAADKKQIGVAMSVDLSSAFDCICHEILDKKLVTYGMGDSVTSWVKSYLSHRSQYVEIGTKMSSIKPVPRGVPQGSVLGPIMFLLYVNELPEVVRKQSCDNDAHVTHDTLLLFGENCPSCGSMTCYADDSTFAVASKSRVSNQQSLTDNLAVIKSFLNANFLCINESKTSLVETMNKQKRCKTRGSPPSLLVMRG